MKRVEVVGVVMGVTVFVLSDPLFPSGQWLLQVLLAGIIAAAGTLTTTGGLRWLTGSSPKAMAAFTTVIIVAAGIADAFIEIGRLDGLLSIVIVVAPYALFRLIVVTVDQITEFFEVSAMAGLVGVVMSATAGPLLLSAHQDLSAWAAFGIGVAIGYVEGVIAGFALRGMVIPKR
jgi:hypothetical protein